MCSLVSFQFRDYLLPLTFLLLFCYLTLFPQYFFRSILSFVFSSSIRNVGEKGGNKRKTRSVCVKQHFEIHYKQYTCSSEMFYRILLLTSTPEALIHDFFPLIDCLVFPYITFITFKTGDLSHRLVNGLGSCLWNNLLAQLFVQ